MKRTIVLLTLAAAACTVAPTADNTPTVIVDGKAAYVVSAGGAVPTDAAAQRMLSKTSTKADMDFIINGTHEAGLPARAAKLCPAGYDILSYTAPVARPEGYDVWSASAKFTLRCK